MLRRIWKAITRPTGFIGRDLEGNSFYERPSTHPSGRTRRIVKYRRAEDQWLYIGGRRRLAIQWSAWLSHTRAHPPTMQELQVDLMRQQRVQQNAEMIRAADEAERQEQQRLIQEGAGSTMNSGVNPESREASSTPTGSGNLSFVKTGAPGRLTPIQETRIDPPSSAQTTPHSKPLPKTGPDEYKPESWAPKTSVQRGR
ncbi:hypothetical protein L218DRAFT_918971 [Marasmius fiardii PR-910]|nr:hypothetical protein L218DRAFT_918971 [Marasmius fiardii PR-910]